MLSEPSAGVFSVKYSKNRLEQCEITAEGDKTSSLNQQDV